MSEMFWIVIALLAFALLWRMSGALLIWVRGRKPHCRCCRYNDKYDWHDEGI